MAGEYVRKMLAAGWSPLCGGRAAAAEFKVEDGSHRLKVLAGDRDLTVYVSPAGRSVRVWVDGVEVAGAGR